MDVADDSAASSRRRAPQMALLYAALVGLPALGVGWTLRVGERLDAPTPVGGEWVVAPAAGGCERAAGRLSLAQSGRRVDGVLTSQAGVETRVTGRLTGDRLALSGRGDGCAHVEARVSRPDADSVASMRATVQSGACGCRESAAALRRARPAAGTSESAH